MPALANRAASDANSLLAALEHCMLTDRARLRRAIVDAAKNHKSFARIIKNIEKSAALVNTRAANLPQCDLPPELPVSQHKDRLIELLTKHQVLVVCGETGSGKSTQLPKICMGAGYGNNGMICQTQPRRIAARSVAERIAEELGAKSGDAVGYRVRFSEQISDQNYIRVLTDGMLLAEFERDRYLNRYSVLIIDEAHERSLNIDFLLGVTKRMLQNRRDMRLIITSATLDSDKFSQHFGSAPIVSVSGRSWPVEIRYQPIEKSQSREDPLPSAIYKGLKTLHQESPGDVLVFLPGERETRETAVWLHKRLKQKFEILPLYARLTPKEQHKIFHPGNKTRIILATNVAETSLTVPRIKFVIDSGLARISRYSPSRKIQRLPVEKIARSAAEQRAGRCGRVSSGICIRLYDEEDYLNRSQYTDPEILRTSLADIILKLKYMGLGDVDTFPFVDKPGRKQINDGIHQLVELGAMDGDQNITAIGRRIAKVPVDPRIARMLLAAHRLNCLQEVVIIAAALSVPDPRQNPADKLQHARQVHRELSSETSDFMVMLNIWQQYREIQKTESKRQAFRWCEKNFLSVFKMREWGALQASIKSSLKPLGIRFNHEKAGPDDIHRALLSGLLCNVAKLNPVDKGLSDRSAKHKTGKSRGAQYSGTFGKAIKIFPGSNMQKKSPAWIMCAELVETTQVFARMVDGIQPGWLELSARHLLQLHYSNPRWEIKQQRVLARRKATLYGLTVYSDRQCNYDKVNPSDCRKIFIQSALVDGEIDPGFAFIECNSRLVNEVESLEHKTRRRNILVDEEVIFDFYDSLIPDWVNNTSSLKKWYNPQSAQQKKRLVLSPEQLMVDDHAVTLDNYPDAIESNGIQIPLGYQFDPGASRDGITAKIHLPLLNQLEVTVFERLVPGLLQEKMISMVRTLPKAMRRQLVPVPDTIDSIAEAVINSRQSLGVALADALNGIKPLGIESTDFNGSSILPHLKMAFELIDDQGEPIDFSRDIEQLQVDYGTRAHACLVDKIDAGLEKQGIKKWDFGELPKKISMPIGDHVCQGYPALVDHEDSVAIEVFEDQYQAASVHREGVRRLLWLALPVHRKLCKKPLPEWQKISLMYAAIGELRELQLAMIRKAQDQVFFLDQEPVRDFSAFNRLIKTCAGDLPKALTDIAFWVADSLTIYRAILSLIEQNAQNLTNQIVEDINSHLEWLVYDGFVDEIPILWLPHVPRFLKAIMIRLEQAVQDSRADQLRQQKILPWWQQYLDSNEEGAALENFRWMVEEYRVSVFAQKLGTSTRISAKRLEHIWRDITISSGV